MYSAAKLNMDLYNRSHHWSVDPNTVLIQIATGAKYGQAKIQ